MNLIEFNTVISHASLPILQNQEMLSCVDKIILRIIIMPFVQCGEFVHFEALDVIDPSVV